ncbi:hypothetical protein CTV99_13225 [Bacillus pumilus]|uniref:Uncharacterized protein n=1 Tax=Bacillus pumilus TaxID=1408 RepID=A0A2G8IS63_BACPU|nr:hypothetical protein CTV99_13225 [Bacillus pumilus]
MIEKKEKNEKTMRKNVSIFSILIFVPLQRKGYAACSFNLLFSVHQKTMKWFSRKWTSRLIHFKYNKFSTRKSRSIFQFVR